MRRFRLGAAAASIVLACSCAREPAAPVVNMQPQPPRLVFIDFNSGFTINLGQSLRLAPTLVDSLGIPLAMPAGLLVISRDTSVFTIDPQTFNLQSIGMGDARVVATVKVNGVPVSDSITVFVTCTTELIAGLEPPVDTIAVGESISPKLTVEGCGGHLHYESLYRWHAADTTIVSVDSLSGRTTGLRVGQTVVTPTANPDIFHLNLSMRVTVRPSP